MAAPRYPDPEPGWFRVSQSALSSWDLCSKKARGDGESKLRDISFYSAVGSVAAELMRKIYAGELDRSDGTGIDKACEVLLDEEVQEAGGVVPDHMNLDMTLEFSKGASKAAAFYLDGTPTAFEEPIVVRLTDDKIELVGTPDREDNHIMRDLKVSASGKKKWNQKKAHETLQPSFYHLERWLLAIAAGDVPDDYWRPDGLPGRGADIDHLWWLKGRKKTSKTNYNQGWNYERFESYRTERHAMATLRRIRNYKSQVESGLDFPAAPDCWACKPQWCRYFDECEFIAGNKEALV